MIKESLYCVPYEKRVLRSSKGVAYHCERDGDAKKSPNLPKSPKLPKKPQSPRKMETCNVCGKEFKDRRAMNIHKTKQKHHVEKPKSAKKSSPLKIKDVVVASPVKQIENRKRNRSYSMSPYEKRAYKAMIRQAKS